MSRIGRMPIAIPAGVEVKIDGSVVTVKGAKATLTREFHPNMTIAVEKFKQIDHQAILIGSRRSFA